MKKYKLIGFGVLLIVFFSACNSNAMNIYALGTSVTNCISGSQYYTKTLNELLPEYKVINAGINGAKPQSMLSSIKVGLFFNSNVKLVLFEPGPNDLNAGYGPSIDVIKYLKLKNIPIIYVSHPLVESEEEGEIFAQSQNIYYYGSSRKNIPLTKEYFTYDYYPNPGHMTREGCVLWAKHMAPFIRKVLELERIK